MDFTIKELKDLYSALDAALDYYRYPQEIAGYVERYEKLQEKIDKAIKEEEE